MVNQETDLGDRMSRNIYKFIDTYLLTIFTYLLTIMGKVAGQFSESPIRFAHMQNIQDCNCPLA